MDARAVERLRSAFLNLAEDFEDFTNPGTFYREEEDDYKRAAARKVRELLAGFVTGSKSTPEEDAACSNIILEAMGTTNFFDWRTPGRLKEKLRKGDWSKLLQLIVALLKGIEQQDWEPHFEALLKWLMDRRLLPGSVKTFVTFFPFMWDPAKHIEIKPTRFDQFLTELGEEPLGNGKHLSLESYKRVLTIVEDVKERLSDWKPRDNIDIHNFLWIALDGILTVDEGDDYEPAVWIETTSMQRRLNDSDWAVGKALVSSTRAKDGSDWYSAMREVQPEDIILHLVDGKFIGTSIVAAPYREIPARDMPTDTKQDYYYVALSGFEPFEDQPDVSGFISEYEEYIRGELKDRPRGYPFILYAQGTPKERVQLAQGHYLCKLTPTLFDALEGFLDVPLIRLEPLDAPEDSKGSQRMWFIGTEGGRLKDRFFTEGTARIGWSDLGNLAKYDSREDMEEANEGADYSAQDWHACFNFANSIKPGDIVLSKSYQDRIDAVGIVRSGYEYDASPDESWPQLIRVDWVVRDEIAVPPGEKRLPIKTVTQFSGRPKMKRLILDALARATGGPKPAPSPVPPSTGYSLDEAMVGVFIAREDVERMLRSLSVKKNVILQGPPGVGKTFIAKRLAYCLIGAKDDSRVSMVQFHQSYAYEDFIQGYRPREDGGFKLQNGVFYEFCRRAEQDREHKYVFIIDEINRGNLSKIFGELMMLIEPDKRGPKFSISLTYSDRGGNHAKFHVPENVHLIGMMNTADRSLAMVDYALRRRFQFVDLTPKFDSTAFHAFLEECGAPPGLISRIIERLGVLNEQIEKDTKNLGWGFQIGHSFFCPNNDVAPDEQWYRDVVEHEIQPLLKEYWFDRPKQVEEEVSKLLA